MTAVLTPDNRIDEMERVIREALRQSMPASIVSTEASGLAAAKNPVSTSPH